MDAVSFVLGVRTAQLRGNLRDLLYNNTDLGASFERPRRGAVKLLFQARSGEAVEFSRHIVPSGGDSFSSQYRIDGHNVTWDVYNEKLVGFGILVKARNFLVFQVGPPPPSATPYGRPCLAAALGRRVWAAQVAFRHSLSLRQRCRLVTSCCSWQGDIESVAGMQPSELTSLVEQIAGTDILREDYERLELAKQAAEEKTSYMFSKKKTIATEKRQVKEQKEEAEKHLQMEQELVLPRFSRYPRVRGPWKPDPSLSLLWTLSWR